MELVELSENSDSPLVVSVPHTGGWVPEEVRRQLALPLGERRSKGDEFAWELARTAIPQATVLRALAARLVIDLNRSGTVSELDLDSDAASERERLVRLYDDQGRLLWKAPIGQPPLTREELERRIRQYHEPYHAALKACLERASKPCVLVDLHSMSDPGFDLVIGDLQGCSAGVELCERRVKPYFAGLGYRVGYAGPGNVDRQGRPVPLAARRYSGGFITGRYGAPAQGRRAFQLEVNRDACRPDFSSMERAFERFWGFLQEWTRDW